MCAARFGVGSAANGGPKSIGERAISPPSRASNGYVQADASGGRESRLRLPTRSLGSAEFRPRARRLSSPSQGMLGQADLWAGAVNLRARPTASSTLDAASKRGMRHLRIHSWHSPSLETSRTRTHEATCARSVPAPDTARTASESSGLVAGQGFPDNV
jgi:hypothetical protein